MQYSSLLKVLTCLKSYKQAMHIIFFIQHAFKDPYPVQKYHLECVDSVKDATIFDGGDKDEGTDNEMKQGST